MNEFINAFQTAKTSEVLPPQGSFDSLPPETFHLQTPQAQIVTIVETINGTYYKPDEIVKPLKVADVDIEELKLLQRLTSREDYLGVFGSYATGQLSYYQSPGYYVPEDVMEDINKALDQGLWHKYIGIKADNNSHQGGEVIHSLDLILESMNLNNDIVRQLSPGKTLGAYKSGLETFPAQNASASLFIGALSPKSVEAIWAISHYLLPNSSMHIIDIEGTLTVKAAKHYRVPFLYMDGRKTSFPEKTYDIIFTNSLIPSMDAHPGPDLYDKRLEIFVEMKRLLKPDGHIIMVEHPLMYFMTFTASEITDEDRLQDKERLFGDLRSAGFRRIEISPIQTHYQYDVDAFLRSGVLTLDRYEPTIEAPPNLIIASY